MLFELLLAIIRNKNLVFVPRFNYLKFATPLRYGFAPLHVLRPKLCVGGAGLPAAAS
jgi:hypothetical protein